MKNKMFFKKVYDKLDGKYSRHEIEQVLEAFSSILIETLPKNETVTTTIGIFKTHKEQLDNLKKFKKITFVPKEEKASDKNNNS
jgi:nucleoid DNA-binding protein